MGGFIHFGEFKNKYYITAELLMDRPLHIGKGISLKPVGTDLPVVKDSLDRPYISGSSIKGVVRSNVEKILRSLEGFKKMSAVGIFACDIFSNPCITQEGVKEIKKKYTHDGGLDEDKFLNECWEKTCLTCRIFGSQWSASRIYFKDMYLSDEGGFVSTEIRDGVAIDRDTGTAKPKMKYDYEIVPAGVSFKLDIILENMEDWEAGIIGLVFKLWQEGEIAIGGKTSAGLGWGRLNNLDIKNVDSDNFLEFIFDTTKKKPVQLEELIKAFRSKLEEKNA